MSGQIRGVRMGSHTQIGGEQRMAQAARTEHRYRTADGHEFTDAFAADAEVPAEWESKFGTGRLVGETATAEEPNGNATHQRTHWDMLKERRSNEELEEILSEQLERLRDRRQRALTDAAERAS